MLKYLKKVKDFLTFCVNEVYLYMKTKPKMITRVTKTEFETDDGDVYPIPFELNEVPTIEEFQRIYDEWFRLFQQKGLIE